MYAYWTEILDKILKNNLGDFFFFFNSPAGKKKFFVIKIALAWHQTSSKKKQFIINLYLWKQLQIFLKFLNQNPKAKAFMFFLQKFEISNNNMNKQRHYKIREKIKIKIIGWNPSRNFNIFTPIQHFYSKTFLQVINILKFLSSILRKQRKRKTSPYIKEWKVEI